MHDLLFSFHGNSSFLLLLHLANSYLSFKNQLKHCLHRPQILHSLTFFIMLAFFCTSTVFILALSVWELLVYFTISPERLVEKSFISILSLPLQPRWFPALNSYAMSVYLLKGLRDQITKGKFFLLFFMFWASSAWPYELFNQQNLKEKRDAWFCPASVTIKNTWKKGKTQSFPPMPTSPWPYVSETSWFMTQEGSIVWKSHFKHLFARAIGYYFNSDINIMLPL